MFAHRFNPHQATPITHLASQGLCDQGFELVSTGGSAAALEKASLPVQRVEQLTGFPEMLDGDASTHILLA